MGVSGTISSHEIITNEQSRYSRLDRILSGQWVVGTIGGLISFGYLISDKPSQGLYAALGTLAAIAIAELGKRALRDKQDNRMHSLRSNPSSATEQHYRREFENRHPNNSCGSPEYNFDRALDALMSAHNI